MHAASCTVSFARMDDNLLIVGCVGILLLSFSARCHGVQSCNYQYQRQPGKANCNPESPLPLELRCQVQGNNNFTIQWHYSNSSFPPMQDTVTSKENIIDSTNYINITAELLSQSLVSILTLEYNLAAGYYWCTLNASDSTPNPSQILHINSTCPFNNGDAAMMPKCEGNIGLFETPGLGTNRCADHNVSIDINDVQLGSTELCEMKATTVTTFDITESTSHKSESLPTTDYESHTSEGQATTERTSIKREQPTTSPTSGFPMHYVWLIVGIAFVLLVAIIIIMLIAIVYLNHKKNKIRATSNLNTYVESGNPDLSKRERATTADQQEIMGEASFTLSAGHMHSPNSETSPSRSAQYEEISPVEDSTKAAQRNQYELVESGDQSEYSHLQHSHGGSRKFRANSTGTAPSPSMTQNRGKVSITSSLSLSGHHPEPIFDGPEYETIDSKLTNSLSKPSEGVINEDAEYSHINCEALTSTETTTRESEYPDLDSEGYHQLLPIVLTGVAKQQPKFNGEISPEERQNSQTTNSHPLARRHKSATSASGHGPYTPVETTNIMKRNTYSFTIVSTDEQYVSERGHMYHLLERSDEHQHNQSIPHSKEGSPKFCIQENGTMEDGKESSSIPPYSQVNNIIMSPEQDSNKQKETEKHEEQSDSSSLQELSMETSHKVIPPYSQVDKSKKKNRQPQVQPDTQLNQKIHHFHQ